MSRDKLYLDFNIILDWIIDRPPFSLDAIELINNIERKRVLGFVSPLALANCYYLICKTLNNKKADNFLKDCLSIFDVIDNTKFDAQLAIEKKHKDFEDDLHYFSAINNGLDYLITRNKNDFRDKKIKIRTAEEYLMEKSSD